MPAGTRGATINAIGSSFPEFLTSFIAVFKYASDDGALFGVFNIIGSYIYNVTIIPFAVLVACVAYRNLGRLKVNAYMIARDSLFVILSLVLLFIMMDRNAITLTDSILLMLIYVFYVVYILNYPKKNDRIHPEKHALDNSGSKPLLRAVLDIDLYAVFFRSHKRNSAFASWVVLSVCVAIFYLTCLQLVASSYALGEALGIPGFLVAMTITAAATSVPDTVLSVKDAKIGKFDDSLTNAIGTNIFNISFCVGFPFFIYNLLYGSDVRIGLDFGTGSLEWLSLALMLAVAAVLAFSRGWWKVKAAVLFALYAGFLCVALPEMRKLHSGGDGCPPGYKFVDVPD
jgi:cation:H+ antiporter